MIGSNSHSSHNTSSHILLRQYLHSFEAELHDNQFIYIPYTILLVCHDVCPLPLTWISYKKIWHDFLKTVYQLFPLQDKRLSYRGPAKIDGLWINQREIKGYYTLSYSYNKFKDTIMARI